MARGMYLKLVLAASAALALTIGSASAQVPVGPNQSFSGVVNGSTANATVYVVCPGPTHPGQLGRPFADKWQVILGGRGFTGSAGNRIVATISPPATAASSTFTAYGVPQAFPATLLLPCSGTGTAVFTPTPTSSTARAAIVTVRFVNIAV
jgi:hypothetical protein